MDAAHAFYLLLFPAGYDWRVYCACVMRPKHNQQNWNKILTVPASRAMIFIAKLLTVSFMILLREIWIGILFVLSGKAVGMAGAVPYRSVIV